MVGLLVELLRVCLLEGFGEMVVMSNYLFESNKILLVFVLALLNNIGNGIVVFENIFCALCSS